MKKVAWFVVACGTLAGSAVVASDGEVAELGWLAGCWQSQDGEAGSGEQWMAPAGGTMLGMSRTVEKGRTVEHEFMQIRRGPDGRLAFIAQPTGQGTTVFPILRLDEKEAVFENPQHDFPQRVIYARDGETRLRVRIEGVQEGAQRSIEFPLRRISCEVPPAEATRQVGSGDSR